MSRPRRPGMMNQRHGGGLCIPVPRSKATMSTAPTPLHRRGAAAHLRPTLIVLAVLLLAAILVMLLVDRIFFDSKSSPAGTGSGVAATQARSLPPFTGVDLAGDNNLIVH